MRPLYSYLMTDSFRYSDNFMAIHKLFSYNPREEFLRMGMEYVERSKLEGDYLEFGVFVGSTFIPAYHFAKRFKLENLNLYAFDSFEGLPDVKGVDAEGFRHFEKGEFALGMERFKKKITSKGVKMEKVKLVPGFYDKVLNAETKKNIPLKKAAFVWIDCDLYESTVPVLNFIQDYLQDGTIIAFDDWFTYRGNPGRGEQKAFREWLEKNPSIKVSEYQKFAWAGNSFIVHL